MVFPNTKSIDCWTKGSILILHLIKIFMKYIHKNVSRILIAALTSAILLPGCKKDSFLDVQNAAAVGSDVAFSTESSADLVLNDVYTALPNFNDFVFEPFETWSDNLMTGFNWNIS